MNEWDPGQGLQAAQQDPQDGDAARQEALQVLDAKLAYIQELLQRMENLAQRASRPECTPPRRARLQEGFDNLRREIDEVADSLWQT